MTWEVVQAIALAFPGTEESTSYGTPSFKVAGRIVTRLRAEDDSLVFLDVNFDEREVLLEADPVTFHITPHYKDHPVILARLAEVHSGTVTSFLERRWRSVAPRRLVKLYDARSRLT